MRPLCIAFLSILAAAGCGHYGPERVVVYGTVKYAGNPVTDGVIRFQPTAGTIGPVSLALIRDGEYRLDVLGGAIVGTHRVEIHSYPPSAAPPSGPGPQRPQLLPAKYNGKSELQVTFVPDEGRRELNFDLTP